MKRAYKQMHKKNHFLKYSVQNDYAQRYVVQKSLEYIVCLFVFKGPKVFASFTSGQQQGNKQFYLDIHCNHSHYNCFQKLYFNVAAMLQDEIIQSST